MPGLRERLDGYYERYGSTEVTFTRQVIASSGLMAGAAALRVQDSHWRCVVYSCSMRGVRIIVEMDPGLRDGLKHANGIASLSFSFAAAGQHRPITFFVPGKVSSTSPVNPDRPGVQFLSLEFTQKPADDLIAVLGSLLDASTNALRRKEERIVLTPETMKRIGLESRESCLTVHGDSRKCLLRDVSFGGAKILVTGANNAYADSEVALKLRRCEERDEAALPGSVIRVDGVEGRSDILALSIRWSADPPMSYKLRLSGWFNALNGPPR